MFAIILENEYGARFEKRFDSEYQYRKFLEKARRSNKLRVISCIEYKY